MDPVATAVESKAVAEELWSDGEIDNPANWENSPVYIFSGTEDEIVDPSRQQTQEELYKSLGANVDYQEEPVGHLDPFYCYDENGEISDDGGHCIRNIVERMLSFVLTNLEAGAIDSLADADPEWYTKGVYRHFWQPDFLSTYLW